MLSEHQTVGRIQFHIKRVVGGAAAAAVLVRVSGIAAGAAVAALIGLDLRDRALPDGGRIHPGMHQDLFSDVDRSDILLIARRLDPVGPDLEKRHVSRGVAGVS